ncbi:MAG: pyruvate kinase [Rickettsiales bacterium]|jgi:pyruvate kinase|nr:pyruvate kinase [Rickettsiales bacterium]
MTSPFRFTKIVATIGPSTEEYENLKKAIESGVDVCRLNFSHGTHEDHKKRFDNIRRIEKELGKKIPVLGDTQGPKLRVGNFEGGMAMLADGQDFIFDSDDKLGDSTRVKLPHPEVLKSLDIGHLVLIDDGKLKVQITEKGNGFVKAKVIVGGKIKDHKGFNLPNTIVPLPILTEKDLDDLEFMLGPDMGVDLVAVSFAQTPDDLRKAKEVIAGRAPMVTKVEKPTAAIDYLPEIIELSDVVMIARGDMGVEVGPEKVPAIQKRMIKLCREKRKPVIVATQMLESMIDGAFPTRAEVTDVANAVYEGTDCTMLSAESASGKYPFEAISTMAKIIREVESDPAYRCYVKNYNSDLTGNTIGDAMSLATSDIVKETGAKAVVAYTTSGTSVINISKHRPAAPIIAITTNAKVAGKMGCAWGVIPKVIESESHADNVDDAVRAVVAKEGLAKPGELVVVSFAKGTAPAKDIFTHGATTLISVVKV